MSAPGAPAAGFDGRWVGAALPRKEDRRMLLGRGRFTGDLTRPGMLHAAFVRSPHAHALVNKIDGTAASQAPGMERLFTAESLGHPYLLALLERDEFVPTAMPILAGKRVAIRLHRYLVVEDCGVVINPLVVDGQVRGGVTQGAAAALLERVSFDPEGQPVSVTLMDYLAPTAAEMCAVDIVHLQTPSGFSETGAKGMGEGGTIGAPAAILNAINDALCDTDVRFDHIPVLPHEVSAALSQAGAPA